MASAPVWPAHKWPYPTPGQGPLPNPDGLPPLKASTTLKGLYGKPFKAENYG